MDLPTEYQGGREQTWLKHQVLRHYLRAWSQKLASVGRHGCRIRLWYIDCFAGIWESYAHDRTDTSVAIGMTALEEALANWSGGSTQVEAGAIFVEKNAAAATRLREFLTSRPNRGVISVVLEGEFGSQVDAIRDRIGDDAAFLFVDPTGWKGAAMRYIAPLAKGRFRDVLVNVMFHHINRWKDDPRGFLREQMRDMFGLVDTDLPPDLSEEELMALYRGRLKARANLEFAADLAVPHPTVDRTFFRLVVGGHAAEVVRLFRDVEERVVGKDAGPVRQTAKVRAHESRTGQTDLMSRFGVVPAIDVRYRRMRDADLGRAMEVLRGRIAEHPQTFGSLWPALLEDHHMTRKHLADAVADEVKAGRMTVSGQKPTERSIKDHHMIAVEKASGGRQSDA